MSKYVTVITLLMLSSILFGQSLTLEEINSNNLKRCKNELINDESKYGVSLQNGDTILPCIYDSIILIEYCSVYLVNNDELWGAFENQSQIVPIEFDYISFSQGMISVQKEFKWGLYNKDGEQLLPCKYNSSFTFNLGLAPISIGLEFGYIDNKGLLVIPMIYSNASPFSKEGLAAVELDNNYGFIDTTGKFAIEPKYDFVQSFYEGYAWFRVDSSINNTFYHGFLDSKGNELFLNEFDNHRYFFSEGLLAVQINQKWGFINFNKDVIIEIRYDSVSEFIDGYAKVNKNGKTIYINPQGKEFVSGLKYHIIKNRFKKNNNAL